MIKFFRHIRQDQIMENKTGKYLKYAIGEIVLVVIGILIALQINNWNNTRIENNRVTAFTQKLKIQIENNITRINEKIKQHEVTFKTSKQLLPIIDGNKTIHSDLKIDSLVLANIYDYHLNLSMNTIIEARENGDLALISSDKLRQAIYKLNTLNETIKERERVTNEDLILLFIPYLNKNYNFRNLSVINNSFENIKKSKLYKSDNSKMLQDQEFENYIITRMEYNKGNLILYNTVRDHLKAIQQLL